MNKIICSEDLLIDNEFQGLFLLPSPCYSSGLLRTLAVLSNNDAVSNNVCSCDSLAIICKPMGRPLLNPAGTDIAGMPVRLASTVSTSMLYIFNGSSILSPNLKGKIGIVGAINTSYFLYNEANSCFNNDLTFWAFM